MTTDVRTNLMRVGNFTSSEIVRLLGVGKRLMTAAELAAREKGSRAKYIEDPAVLSDGALTYIQERNFERLLGRSLDNETSARATSWGSLVERRVHNLLGIEYQLANKDTLVHPTYPFWSGTPDARKYDDGRTVGDFKCPMTLMSFCQLVEGLRLGLIGQDAINHVREFHKEGETYYQQLISNAILTDSAFAELIVYVPYKDELDEIRELANNWDGDDQHRFFWVANARDEELPYLVRGGKYRNINTIRWEVSKDDRNLLIDKVRLAGKQLIEAF
jgi:hypothetical protein